MRIQCSTELFRSAVLSLQNVAQAKISVPVGENILIRAAQEKVEFLATNRSLDVRYWGEAVVHEAGELAIFARIAQSMVRELYDETVEMSSLPRGAVLRCGAGEYRLQTVSTEDFPEFEGVADGVSFGIDALDVRKGLRRTVISTTSEISRFELDGVRMEVGSEVVVLVATDGRRLSRVTIPGSYGVERCALVPTATVEELLRLLPEEGKLECCLGLARVSFSGENFTLVSTLLEDNFPPHEQIVPREEPAYFEVETEQLARGVRSATVMAAERGRMIYVSLREGVLEFSGENEEAGRASFQMGVDYKGEPFQAAYRSTLLLDFLRVVESSTTMVGLLDVKRPAIMRPKGDDSYLHLIMPMRMEDATEGEGEEAGREEGGEEGDE